MPIAQWLPRYERSFLGADLLAGLAVWAVLVPQAVAYAALAGAPPEAGLFAALAAGVAYAVFGTCRQLDVGPSSTICDHRGCGNGDRHGEVPRRGLRDPPRRARRADGRRARSRPEPRRLGFVSEFLARPVLVGFISGIGLVIIVGQIPTLLGLTVETGNVPETLWRTIGALDEISWETAAVGFTALVALLVLRRLAPRVSRGRSLVTAVSVVLSRAFDLAAHGVAVIADVPAGLPTPTFPGVGLGEIGALSSGALALALVALAESLGAARSLAAQRGYEIDPNQELIALGASNVGAGLLQGFPVDASLSRSAVGSGAGVKTRLSGLFVARAARRHDAVPDAALRRPATGDARCNHHRGRDRARRREGVPAAVADRPG